MATRNIVPRSNAEGSIGTATKKWLSGYFNNIYSKVTGDVTGNLTGDVTGNLTGDVTGNLTGDVTGNLTGDVTGNLTGVPYLLRRSTAYSIGDLAHHSGLPKWGRLECVTAGVTTATLPALPTTAGSYVTDGTAKFILCDVRDMVPVGMVIGDTYLHSGYVKANGATVNRADYPRLTKLATDNSLFTASQSSYLGLFGVGDGSSTMVLPNWVGKTAQYAATGGNTVAAGLPNITGGTDYAPGFGLITNAATVSGCITKTTAAGGSFPGGGTTTSAIFGFNAAMSNSIYGASTTVQPPAINVIPQIKY